MSSIGFFLMGEKGLSVLKGIKERKPEFMEIIKFIVSSEDRSIESDKYNEIKKLCLETGLRFYNKNEVDENQLKANYAFAISWRWLIQTVSFELIVLHDSLLPKYRGFNPLVTALVEGDKKIGVTAIEANKEFDSGDIYEQESLSIEYPIKINEAIKQISELYLNITLKLLNDIQTSSLKSYEQDETQVSYSLWRNEEDYRIDWTQNSNRLERFVNAVGHPYKGAITTYDGLDIRLIDVESVADIDIANRKPGKILKIENNCPLVVCGEGLLRIVKAKSDKNSEIVNFYKLRVCLQ